MKRFALFGVALLLAGCSTSDYDHPTPAPERRRPPMAGEARGGMREGADGVFGVMPLENWWHDPQIAEPLNLSNDQYTALDRIQSEQADEIARLQRDSMVTMRDFRQALTADKPTQDDIVAAGQRVRALRDQILDRQVKMIAAERVVLTADQWQKLQQQLREDRNDWRNNRNVPGRPGRGGMGPRGGRGGWSGGF